MKVLFIAAEVTPFSKVGGLADVAGALPKALGELGHDVRFVTPMHSSATSFEAIPRGTVSVSIAGQPAIATIYEARGNGGVPVYLLDNSKYFRRDVYGEPDDLDRFLFLSLAAAQVPSALGWQPDVVHAHDWHAAMALRSFRERRNQSNQKSPALVFTIHNLQYQGNFDSNWLTKAMPGDNAAITRTLDSFEVHPCMMAMGIISADVVNTVSETYAKEILTIELGFGLNGLLLQRSNDLCGIVNGLDYDVFDPATDKDVAANFDVSSHSRRSQNKAALQQKLRLKRDPDLPLLGMVTRLADQKGIDILTAALPSLLQTSGIQFVVLGTGDEKYVAILEELAANFPLQFAYVPGFDGPLGQLIYGGSDIFVMPSRFEPCGLGQLIAMRYGAIPLVRSTGGLADTVVDCTPTPDKGTGFVFQQYSSSDLSGAIRRATDAYRNRARWHRLIERVMSLDFSWSASAKKYDALYTKAVAKAKLRGSV